MSKKFLTLKGIEEKIVDGKLYLDKDTILAFSVKDYLVEKEIKVVYEGTEEKSSLLKKEEVEKKQEVKEEIKKEVENQTEDISKIIERLLRNDFGIQEQGKIEEMIRIVKGVLK